MGFVREPAVSGTFYPANPSALMRDIQGYLKDAGTVDVNGKIVGIISPHAGYMYSGPVAAYGYKAFSGETYDTVVVIAPSHRAYFQGVATITNGSFKTPLGLVRLDEELCAEITGANRLIGTSADVHRQEHALEVQLPFLQVVLKDFMLVPLIMGAQDEATCRMLAESLADSVMHLKRKALIVGSTDLSHYHPHSEAVKLDNVIIKRIKAFDEAGLMDDIGHERCEACGAGPIAATMMVSKGLGATKSKALRYATSGDVSGDKTTVVGYLSAVFYKELN